MSRKEGTRELASIEGSVDAAIQRLEDYIEKCEGRLITATRNNTDNTKTNRTKNKKWEENQLFGLFKRQTSDISYEKTWTYLKIRNLKRETGSLQIAAPNNAIKTN